MTTYTLTKQLSEQCRREIRFTVFGTDAEDHRAVEVVVYQGFNNGKMLQHSRNARYHIGNSRNLYRSLLNQGWTAA